jgi:hypothetical protein
VGVRAGVVVGSAALALLLGCDTGSQPVIEPGPQLLAQMVSGRIAAGDIPDHGLPIQSDTLFVVQEGESDTRWGSLRSEYFDSPDTHVVVTTIEALREISAAHGGERVPYLAVRGPRHVSGVRWHLYLGGDYVVAEPEFTKLCCCTGEAIFDLNPDRVDFVDWGTIICA